MFRKREKKDNSIWRMILPSLISVMVCSAAFIGSTWAWFTATQITEVEPIMASTWSLSQVTVNGEDAGGNSRMPGGRRMQFDAEASTLYEVAILGIGNAETGHILLRTADGNYYTSRSAISFSMILSQSGTVTVEAGWGRPNVSAKPFWNGDRLGAGTLLVPEVTTQSAITTPSGLKPSAGMRPSGSSQTSGGAIQSSGEEIR